MTTYKKKRPFWGRRSQDAILRDVLAVQMYTNFVSKQ